MLPNTKTENSRSGAETISASDCSDSPICSGRDRGEATYSNCYTSLPPDRPRKKQRNPRKRSAGRPKSRRAAYRRGLPKRHENVIPWKAIKAITRADRKAIVLERPLETFVSLRWAYSKHEGQNKALMVNRFFAAAQAFYKRHGHHMTYISTMENPPRGKDGFHTHLMVHVPKALVYSFPEWLRSYVGGKPEAVDIRSRTEPPLFQNRRTRLNYMLKACEHWAAGYLGKDEPSINPNGKWDFEQGKMPPGIRRWRISADLQTPEPDKPPYPEKVYEADGDDIKVLRTSLGWSAKKLADAAGVNRNSIIHIEKPGPIPLRRGYVARRVAKAFEKEGLSLVLRPKRWNEPF